MKTIAFSLIKEFLVSILTDSKAINYIKNKFFELVNTKRKEVSSDEHSK